MNAATLAKRLLLFTDHRTLAEANTAGAEYLEAAVDAINAAAQQIYLLGPETISIRDFGYTTRPNVTLAATGAQYATTVDVPSGLESWMSGCTFDSGAITANRILDAAVSEATGNIVVAGAGISAANGVYVRLGTVNSRPMYASATDLTYSLFWGGSNWAIYENPVMASGVYAKYTSTDDVASPDLATTWSATSGAAPAPTVTAEMSSSTSLNIQNQLDQAITAITVYNDAVAISADIIEVLGNVTLDDSITLRAATNEANLYSESAIYGSSDYGRTHESRIAARPPVPGQPRAYYIANLNPNTSGGQPTLYMRLCPYPTTRHVVRFRARVKPPAVAVSDLDAANNGAACTKQIPIPFGWDESFLLPIAKQHFTACPFFNNASQREEIARAFKTAMENLDRTRGQSARPLNFVPTI